MFRHLENNEHARIAESPQVFFNSRVQEVPFIFIRMVSPAGCLTSGR
jgi:hypothetical protein